MTLQEKADDFVSKHIPPNSAIYVTMKKQDIIDIVCKAYIQAYIDAETALKQKSPTSGSIK